MSDAKRRHHEVRIGMSVYWAQTWPEKDGYAWTAHDGRLAGYVEGSRFDALTEIRNGLLARESLRSAAGLAPRMSRPTSTGEPREDER